MIFEPNRQAFEAPSKVALVYIHRRPDGSYSSNSVVLSNSERISMFTSQRLLRDACDGKDYFLPSQVGLSDLEASQRHEFFALDVVDPFADQPVTSDLTLSQVLSRFQEASAQGWKYQAPDETIEGSIPTGSDTSPSWSQRPRA